jgi:hypothetical protein
MPLLGQASGGWTESSSALRILNVGIRNSLAKLTDDAFTQTNPPAVTTAGTISAQVDQTLTGVLSGSVAFNRPDQGADLVGGPGDNTVQTAIRTAANEAVGYRPLGVFINSANGNAFENTPGTASGLGPYVSACGTYGNRLFETDLLAQVTATQAEPGLDITYVSGMNLVASRNGYLMPEEVVGLDGNRYNVNLVTTVTAEQFVRTNTAMSSANNLLTIVQRGGPSTVIGVLKMPPDSTQNELVYDQRI